MKTHFPIFQAIISSALMLTLLVSCGNNVEPADVKVEYSSIDHLRMFFENLHPNDQRSVFGGLPSELQYAMINSHWTNQLSMTDNKNEQEFIQDLLDHLKPAYYADSALFESEGAEYFGKQIEVGLTVYQDDSSKLSSILLQVGGDTQAEISIAAAALPDCECNIAHDLCVFGDCGTFDCKILTGWGCGPGYLYSCDGMCLMK